MWKSGDTYWFWRDGSGGYVASMLSPRESDGYTDENGWWVDRWTYPAPAPNAFAQPQAKIMVAQLRAGAASGTCAAMPARVALARAHAASAKLNSLGVDYGPDVAVAAVDTHLPLEVFARGAFGMKLQGVSVQTITGPGPRFDFVHVQYASPLLVGVNAVDLDEFPLSDPHAASYFGLRPSPHFTDMCHVPGWTEAKDVSSPDAFVAINGSMAVHVGGSFGYSGQAQISRDGSLPPGARGSHPRDIGTYAARE